MINDFVFGDLIVVDAGYESQETAMNTPVMFLSILGEHSMYVIYKNKLEIVTILDSDNITILSAMKDAI